MLRDLVAARDDARVRAHLLGMDARRRLSEIELEIEAFEHKLSARGDWVAEHVIATARGFTRAVGELVVPRNEQEPTRARDVMKSNPVSCRPSDNLSQAAQRMWDGDFGALPVVDDEGKPVGMLTDRDVCMAAYTRGSPLCELSVRGAMSNGVHTCKANDSLRALLDAMTANKIRRMPIVADDGTLVGIVSLADLARLAQAPSALSHEARAWLPGVLAGISEPTIPADKSSAAA